MVLGSAYCFTISALNGPFDGVVTINCVLGQPRNCLDQLFDTQGSLLEVPRRNDVMCLNAVVLPPGGSSMDRLLCLLDRASS